MKKTVKIFGREASMEQTIHNINKYCQKTQKRLIKEGLEVM